MSDTDGRERMWRPSMSWHMLSSWRSVAAGRDVTAATPNNHILTPTLEETIHHTASYVRDIWLDLSGGRPPQTMPASFQLDPEFDDEPFLPTQFTVAAFPPPDRPHSFSFLAAFEQFWREREIRMVILDADEKEGAVRLAVATCRMLGFVWNHRLQLQRRTRWILHPIPPRRTYLRLWNLIPPVNSIHVLQFLFSSRFPKLQACEDVRAEIDVVAVRRAGDTLLLWIPPEIRQAVKDSNAAKLDGNYVYAEPYYVLQQCVRCADIGHVEAQCITPDPKCMWCAGSHTRKECPHHANPDRYQCHLCLRIGCTGASTKHSAGAGQVCPVADARVRRELEETDPRIYMFRLLQYYWLKFRRQLRWMRTGKQMCSQDIKARWTVRLYRRMFAAALRRNGICSVSMQAIMKWCMPFRSLTFIVTG